MVAFPNGITVTWIKVTTAGIDGRGNAIREEEEIPLAGCIFVPGQASETTQGSETTIFDAELYVPAGTGTGPKDKFIVNGVTYQVTGDTSSWQSPFSRAQAPDRLRLRDVSGVGAHSSTGGAAAG